MTLTERIQRLAEAAYVYEFMADNIMSDHEFDQESLAVEIDFHKEGVPDPILSSFMKTYFSPSTGMWIYNYPYKEGLDQKYG